MTEDAKKFMGEASRNDALKAVAGGVNYMNGDDRTSSAQLGETRDDAVGFCFTLAMR